jgi:pyruvate kinase
VQSGGAIGSRKGVNLPDAGFQTITSLTRKDIEDVRFGIRHGVDCFALSFVRTGQDIRDLKHHIKRCGADAPVIAKVEKHEALRNLHDIAREADGVMVARGDLGVETELETVALKQKEIISYCNSQGKLVITATQMLESMVSRPEPTRAEVADITNAIFDGTDAVMLSAETAAGEYPIEAVTYMARIARKTEDLLDPEKFLFRDPADDSIARSIALTACLLAREVQARAMLVCTYSGTTARHVARFRPLPPIIAVCPDARKVRALSLTWGVHPFLVARTSNTDALTKQAIQTALRSGLVTKGQRVVMCAGLTTGKPGDTNFIKAITL